MSQRLRNKHNDEDHRANWRRDSWWQEIKLIMETSQPVQSDVIRQSRASSLPPIILLSWRCSRINYASQWNNCSKLFLVIPRNRKSTDFNNEKVYCSKSVRLLKQYFTQIMIDSAVRRNLFRYWNFASCWLTRPFKLCTEWPNEVKINLNWQKRASLIHLVVW